MALFKRKIREWLKARGGYDKVRRQRIVADVVVQVGKLRANWANCGVQDPSSVEIMYSCRSYIDDAEASLIHAQFTEARDALIDGAAAMVNAAEEIDKMCEGIGEAVEDLGKK